MGVGAGIKHQNPLVDAASVPRIDVEAPPGGSGRIGELVAGKVTKNVVQYPEGLEPDLCIPQTYGAHRFVLGKAGKNPVVAVCMNPSAAREDTSDRTINRIISVGRMLGKDGWIVFNTYPERATNAVNIGDYDKNLCDENLGIMRKYLIGNNIREVWGAWGDLRYHALREGRTGLIGMFDELGIKIFYFGTLTKRGNPRHPLQRRERWTISEGTKNYLN